jgi:hypothetical protein
VYLEGLTEQTLPDLRVRLDLLKTLGRLAALGGMDDAAWCQRRDQDLKVLNSDIQNLGAVSARRHRKLQCTVHFLESVSKIRQIRSVLLPLGVAGPAFRETGKNALGLILAKGYYEWKKTTKPKQPYYYRMKDEKPFTFADLWESWHGEDKPLETCAILTTDANELAMEVHDRMPVILTGDDALTWLDPATDPAALGELLRPFPSKEMVCKPVSVAVGNVRNIQRAPHFRPLLTWASWNRG